MACMATLSQTGLMLTVSEACERNKVPILEVLRAELATAASVLEVGSGTGQHAVHFAHPRAAPRNVLIGVLPVVVLVVFVADVGRRIGEHQIDRARFDLLHQLDAVALMDFADREGLRSEKFRFDRHAGPFKFEVDER